MFKIYYKLSYFITKCPIINQPKFMEPLLNNTQLCKILINSYSTIEIKNDTKNSLKELFAGYFNISTKCSNNLIDQYKLVKRDVDDIEKTLKYCSKFKISKNVIKENLWLAEMRSDVILKRLNTISTIKLENIDHGVPFLKLPTKSLIRLCFRITNEVSVVPHGNRLYYLSTEMKMEPSIISKYISKRTFLYTIPFEDLKETLAILLDMGVTADSILKDLWVLRYKPFIVKERMEKLKKVGKKRLMPWMVKCPTVVLERSINLTMVTKSLLGENKSVINYLAERLNCTTDVVFNMAKNTPYILIVRVVKVKNTLDFLFSEGYSESDIIKVPRVLAHSIKTMKSRIGELRAIGVFPKNLYILCKSKRDFKKYLEAISKIDFEVDPKLYMEEKKMY